MNRIVKALVVFFLFSTKVFGQSPVLLNQEGDKHFNNGQYAQASQFYQQALDTEPNNQLATFQLAECFRMTLKYQEAELQYEKMVKLSEGNYPMSRYYFALMQKLNGKYDQAMPNFQLFLDRFAENPARMEKYAPFRLQALVEREGCLLALNELAHPVRESGFRVLAEPLNTEYSDYAPFIFKGDSSLIITSSRKSTTGGTFDARMGESTADLFRFEFKNGLWQELKSGDRFTNLNTKNGEGSGIFNKDLTKVYFTYNPPEGTPNPSQIYKADLIDGKWGEPRALNININARNTESRHPSLTSGNDTLFFVSNRAGGQGGWDIWYSVDAGNDNWGPAINLGPSINTSLDEISPFYDHKESVLFFSSNGHRGFGAYDIFMTSGYNFDNSEIYNMGYPYNSNRDDLFFILGNKTGYLTSGRDGGVGGMDIYAFSIETDEEIIAEILEDDAIAGRTSIFSDDYDFDSNNIEKIEEIISHMLAARMFNTEVMLTTEELAFYESLSQSDKEKIERIINSRVRKMSENDMRAVRTEDEFYYQQLASGDKYSINRMVSSYLEEDGLGLSVSLSQEEKTYYEKLSKDAKEKVDQYITMKVTEYRKKEVKDEYYESLPESDKTQVKSLARTYLIQKKALPNLAVSVSANMFLKKQTEEDLAKAESTIINQLKNLATESDYSLTADDRVFYQNLSSDEKEAIDRLVTAFLATNPTDFEKSIQPTDLEFYNRRSAPQKILLDKIIAKRIRNLSFSDEYVYTHATSKQTDLLASLNAKTNGNVVVPQVATLLTGINKDVFNGLDPKEKLRFARMVSGADVYVQPFDTPLMAAEDSPTATTQLVADKSSQLAGTGSKSSSPSGAKAGTSSALMSGTGSNARTGSTSADGSSSTSGGGAASGSLAGTGNASQSVASAGNQGVTASDQRSDEGELIIDRSSSGEQVGKVPTNRSVETIDEGVRAIYEDMAEPKRKSIDRIVAVSVINDAYASQPDLFEVDKARFNNFSADDKKAAKRLARYLVEDQLSDAEMAVIKIDFMLYKNFNSSLRKTFNHLILQEAFTYSSDKNQMELPSADKVKRSQLSAEERSLVNSLIGLRATSNYLFGDNIDLENKYGEAGMIIASVDQFQTQSFKSIKIQGKLIDLKTGKPMVNYPVTLANAQGESLKIGYTNRNGEFVFDYLDGNKSYKILSDADKGKAFKPDDFFIKDLQVRGYKDAYVVQEFEGIYFESDGSAIKNEGFASLNKLVQLYKTNPSIEIEIHAHSDSQGEHDYNHNLSNQRGSAVYDYLVQGGVDETALTVYAKGEGDPVASNLTAYGRAFNRRVELEVYSTQQLSADVAKFYVTRPGATMPDVARAFSLTEQQIMAMNGLKSNAIKPYSILRVEGKNNVKPSLNLLVELNDHAVNYKQYRVQQGESIITIAEKFNLPEELLIELNGLNGPQISPGSVIDIYVSY